MEHTIFRTGYGFDWLLKQIYPHLIQLTAQIYDGGNPSLTGSQLATINIIVSHNLFCPEFTNLPASKTIFLNDTGAIFMVTARDQDTYVSISCRISCFMRCSLSSCYSALGMALKRADHFIVICLVPIPFILCMSSLICLCVCFINLVLGLFPSNVVPIPTLPFYDMISLS